MSQVIENPGSDIYFVTMYEINNPENIFTKLFENRPAGLGGDFLFCMDQKHLKEFGEDIERILSVKFHLN